MGDRPSTPCENRFEQLLEDARGGSREALGKLLNPFRRYLLHLGAAEIGGELQPKGGASDLVQDTFVVAQRAIPRFHGNTEEEFRAWLRQIFLRTLSGFRRHYQARSKRQIVREVSLDDGRVGHSLKNSLEASRSSPEREASRSEHSQRLHEAIEHLPSLHREVVILRSREGLHFDEIGDQLGCSADAARKVWKRAVDHLAASLTYKAGLSTAPRVV
jgi:RNA polymerase sigma-70 factor (ECF subfamily)